MEYIHLKGEIEKKWEKREGGKDKGGESGRRGEDGEKKKEKKKNWSRA